MSNHEKEFYSTLIEKMGGAENFKVIYFPKAHQNALEYLAKHLGLKKYQEADEAIDALIKTLHRIDIKTYDDRESQDTIFKLKTETIYWVLDFLELDESLLVRNECYQALFGDEDLAVFNQWSQKSLF